MIASLFYSGQAQLPCFAQLQYQWYNKKVCLKAYFVNSSICKSNYLNNGVQALFAGFEGDHNYPQDLTRRKTFFYMKINQTIQLDWFGRFNQICAQEENSTGQFQGQNMIYGTFSQRIYDFGKYLQAQPSNLSSYIVFKTNYELEVITNYNNQMIAKAFVWIYLFSAIIIVLTCLVVWLYFK
ncbi:Conserved_hypothetical protein [Hexamita inflata]|uniref:Transmembrane protein n=1 Tax=Hexamita inflata TaxID=28002 RepID=A0ABP1GW78_9EUKA